jgi:hypothetical protein
MTGERSTASNGRFHASGAVTPQTILWKFARYYPAASLVEAATSQSRWDVARKRATAQRDTEVEI